MCAWPPEQTVILKLPSGKKMEARLPEESFLGLCGMAIKMGREDRGESRAEIGDAQTVDLFERHASGAENMSDAEVIDVANAMGAVLMYACVKPRISLKPRGPDEIHPDGLSLMDAVFIIRWALRRVHVFERLRHNHRPKVDRKRKQRGNR
jgi:hypothetical protein